MRAGAAVTGPDGAPRFDTGTPAEHTERSLSYGIRFGATDRPRGGARGQRLHERSEVIAEIRHLLSGTWEYPRCPMLIEGLPGTGKTALLNVALEVGRNLGMRVGRARCDAAEAAAAYGVVRQLFGSLGFNQALSDATADDGTDLARRILRGGVTPMDDPFDAYNSLMLLLGTTGNEPVLLGVDDVQLADQMSVGWLQFLSRRLTTAPVHMVLTTSSRRSGNAPGRDPLLFNPSTRRFVMHPLSAESTVTMLAQHRSDEVDPEVGARAHFVTGGNPLLIARMLIALDETGKAASAIAEHDIDELASPAVARSVQSLVATLPVGSVDLLEAIAVLGECDPRSAAEVAGLDADTTARLADVLADIGLLDWDRPLKFSHPFERHSFYAAIQPARRNTLHCRAAQTLAESSDSPDESTQHLLATDPVGDEWIASALVDAARQHLDANNPEQASVLLQRADREIAAGPSRAEIARLRAQVDGVLGRETAVDHLARAARFGSEPVGLAETALDLLDREHDRSSCAAILDIVERSRDQLVVEHPQLALRLQLAESVLVPATARSTGGCSTVDLDDEVRGTPVGKLAATEQLLREAAAMECTHDELVTNLPRLMVDVLGGAGLVHTSIVAAGLAALVRVGAYEVAQPLLRTVIAESEQSGRRDDANAYRLILAESLAMQGRVVAADQALSSVRLDRPDLVSRCAAMQLRFFADLRERALHEPLVVAAVPPSFAPGMARLGSSASMFLAEMTARVQSLEGDWLDALANWDRVAAGAHEAMVDNPSLAPWRLGKSIALSELGRLKEGAAIAAQNLELSRRFGSPVTIAEALACAARFAPADAQVDLLTEAVSLLAITKAELLRCNLLIDLGFARHYAGDAAAARTAFRDGADHATRLGVTRLAGVAGRGLLACGARPRRLQTSGLQSLTPAELRVVRLAADGQTNVAIASTLFVNLKTVESHLTRAYRKLGISDRADLKSALEDKHVEESGVGDTK